MKGTLSNYLSLVKFSHTIFALPFAMVGLFSAVTIYQGQLTVKIILLILAAMVLARNTAMAFNRFIDRDIDAKNPRTSMREIPSGQISNRSAILFININAILFVAVCYFINSLAFYLSPVALIVIIGYSLFKRFSWLCHIILGLALSIAPVGATIAVLGHITPFSLYLAGIVICWVSGFDILYALQDRDFDKSNSLKSIPTFLGIKGALIASALLHLLSILGVIYIGYKFDLNTLYYISAAIFSLILIIEHIIVTPKNITRVNLAFATMNGTASLIYGTTTIISFII